MEAKFLVGSQPGDYPPPYKPCNDKTEYRNIVLPSGMAVSLQKTGGKQAVVSVTVRAGSFYDPEEWPGLAHLVEHMIFMGSASYPWVDGLDKFFKVRDGMVNATTGHELVTYYFDVNANYLDEALDHLTDALLRPMFHLESIQGEIPVVHHEFTLKKSGRQARFLRLLSVMGDQNHPRRMFNFGNKDSLAGGQEMRKTLMEFMGHYYVGSRMSLAVSAPQELILQEKMVLNAFCTLHAKSPKTSSSLSIGTNLSHPFADTKFCKLYRVVPLYDMDELRVSWCLPSDLEHFRHKPLAYILHLMKYEGRGSLLVYLRNRFLAYDLDCGISEFTSCYSILTVSIHLTKLGFSNKEQVLTALFSYLAMIRRDGVKEEIHKGLQIGAMLKFQLGDKEPDPVDDLIKRSTKMHYYPPEYLLSDGLYEEFDANCIKKYLARMTMETANIMYMSQVYEGTSNLLSEHWTKVEYQVEDIPLKLKWTLSSVEPFPEFCPPPENIEFLSNRIVKVYDAKNYGLKIGQGTCNFGIEFTDDLNVNMATAMDVYAILLEIRVTPDICIARHVGLEWSIDRSERKITFAISGISNGLPKLVRVMANHLQEFPANVSYEEFLMAKDMVLKMYQRECMQPMQISREFCKNLLIHNYLTPVDKYPILQGLTPSAFKELCNKPIMVNCEFQGQIAERARRYMSDTIARRFQNQIQRNIEPPRVAMPGKGQITLTIPSFNSKDAASVVTNYYQVGPFSHGTFTKLCTFVVLLNTMEYNVLRTQRHMGYSVETDQMCDHGIMGLTLSVATSASLFSTSDIDKELDQFLESSVNFLSYVPHSDLTQAKNEVYDYVADHVSLHGDFGDDEEDHIDEHLETVTFDSIKFWARKYFLRNSSEYFRKISVQIVGNPEQVLSTTPQETADPGTKVDDAAKPFPHLRTFRSSLVHMPRYIQYSLNRNKEKYNPDTKYDIEVLERVEDKFVSKVINGSIEDLKKTLPFY